VLLGTLTVEAKDDSYDLRAVSFVQSGNDTLPLGDARLSWAGTDGKTVSVTTPFLGGNIQFSALPVTVESGKSLVLSLYAKVGPRDSGTKPGTLLPIRFQENGGFEYVSRSTKKGNAGHTVSKNVLSTLTTRYTLLSVTQDAGSPSGSVYRATDTEVLWFSIRAEPEGQARIKKLSFNLRPGDAGSGDAGFEQDALEFWAKMNGDFEDDDSVISLVRYQGTSRTVLGEGSGASIDYGIVRNGVKSKASSTLTSAPGDYGNVTITFDEGNELTVGPGALYTFRLEVVTTGFNPQKEHSFSVDMAGAHDFTWTDIPSGAYTPLSGVDIGMAGPAGVLTVRR